MSTIEPSYRYIVHTPGVRGGHARVDGTRIGVHDVIGLLQNGETVDSLIANCFPDLTRAQVYECLAYYEDHRGEIDTLVARQMSPGQGDYTRDSDQWLSGLTIEQIEEEIRLLRARGEI